MQLFCNCTTGTDQSKAGYTFCTASSAKSVISF